MATYEERQEQPVTLRSHTARNVWKEIKEARDHATYMEQHFRETRERLDILLMLLKEDGCAAHLPTIEEAQAAWRGELEG